MKKSSLMELFNYQVIKLANFSLAMNRVRLRKTFHSSSLKVFAVLIISIDSVSMIVRKLERLVLEQMLPMSPNCNLSEVFPQTSFVFEPISVITSVNHESISLARERGRLCIIDLSDSSSSASLSVESENLFNIHSENPHTVLHHEFSLSP